MQFVGREQELELLRKQWRNSQFGKINVVVLEAESRMGKTRIVQEFYVWLSSNKEDPQNYWPDTLPRGGDSLAVNPNFETPTEAVLPPWLWWGLRWTNPDARNQQDIPPCIAISASKHLEKHLAGLKDDIKRSEANKKALEGLAKSGINLATAGTFEFANQVLQTGIEVSERIQDWLDIRCNKGASSQDSISDRDQKVKETELEVLRNLLVTMATTDKIILGGLPLILVLDDVHWADQESLDFLQRLIRELIHSKKKPPQLFIIATVWEREWKSQHDMPLSSQVHSKPQNFYEVLTALQIEAKNENLSTINIIEHNLMPLKAEVEKAIAHELPGLTETQNRLLIEKSGGSPGLLYELILKLRDRNRHLFENSDSAKKLTLSGENAVKKMTVHFHDLVEERMSYLSNAEGTLMRLASYLGLSYSRPFLKELSRYVNEYEVDFPQDSNIDSAIDRADKPLAIIQKIAEQLDEFRLPIYRDVLNKQLIEHETLWQCLNQKIPNLLIEWLEDEKLQQMSADERSVFLQFAQQELNARLQETQDKSIAIALFKTLTAQIVALVATGRIAPMHALFQQWFTQWHQAPENSQVLTEAALNGVFECANMLSRYDAIEILCQDYLHRQPISITTAPKFTEPSERQLICSMWLIFAFKEQNKVESALIYAKNILQITMQMLETLGDNEPRLRSVSVLLNMVGDLLVQNDHKKNQALELFEESLSIRRRLLAEFGDSEQRWCDVSFSLIRIGDLLMQIDHKKNQALEIFEESLSICRRLLDEFGDSEQHLMNLGASLDRVGKFLAQNDQKNDRALKLFEESLSICRCLLAKFGNSEQRLRNLAASLDRVGDLLAQNDQKNDTALELFNESFGIRRRLLAEFGDSEQRLRNAAVSCHKLEMIYVSNIGAETHYKAEALSHAKLGWGYAKKLAKIAPESHGQAMADWFQATIDQLT